MRASSRRKQATTGADSAIGKIAAAHAQREERAKKKKQEEEEKQEQRRREKRQQEEEQEAEEDEVMVLQPSCARSPCYGASAHENVLCCVLKNCAVILGNASLLQTAAYWTSLAVSVYVCYAMLLLTAV